LSAAPATLARRTPSVFREPDAMAVATIEIASVRKTFGPTVALNGASLRAYEGEVHAIIGGNGSGKSTLAKVISGVLIPDSGQVSIFGKSASSPLEAKALGIADVYQEVLVTDECSVLDNLYIGADNLFSANIGQEEKIRKATVLMHELLGFDLDLETPVGDLPLSIKQWITIARALLTDPKVLILDESSAALDFDSTERLFRKMRELKNKGASILMVSHRIAELVRIADRATVLRDGVDVGFLQKEEITVSRIFELIAGPERGRTLATQSVAERLSQAPVLRVEGGRVWHDAGLIDFTLYPGEIVGITGLDGQGQTDFVRCLAGVQSLVSGRISVIDGKNSEEVNDLTSAHRNAVTYVSGDRKKEGIFPNLSIFENLLISVYQDYRLGGWLNLIDQRKLQPVFEWESDRLAVKMGSGGNLITSLSGGNQQKVLIARSFAEKPNVLVLNDPARGIDIGAKLDLYRNLRDFAAKGKAVVFLSSEIEEFLNLCSRVLVFRNGAISSQFAPPFDGHVILNAMFGRRASAALPGESNGEGAHEPSWQPREGREEDGRALPRAVKISADAKPKQDEPFNFGAPDIAPGTTIPQRFAEDNKVSPRLVWSGVPAGTKSLAISVTDPDLPEEFNFPRAFAHWLVFDIPVDTRELAEGASGSPAMPASARELNSDFVTFKIAGFGRGYGGPWPPDRSHRYVFTLFALKAEHLDIADDASLASFAAAVLPLTIASQSFVAHYGPAKKPLPT
jgi:Raf kinase inhibitor-like YbhB/YbcL family protein